MLASLRVLPYAVFFEALLGGDLRLWGSRGSATCAFSLIPELADAAPAAAARGISITRVRVVS